MRNDINGKYKEPQRTSRASGPRLADPCDPTSRVVRIIAQIRFAPGSPFLMPASRMLLDQYAVWLGRAAGGERFYVEAPWGADDSESGEALVMARAESVRRYLCAKLRVPGDRIGIVPAGASLRVAGDESREGGERGRRSVVLVLR